jgi:hypothetical protein
MHGQLWTPCLIYDALSIKVKVGLEETGYMCMNKAELIPRGLNGDQPENLLILLFLGVIFIHII